MNCALRSLELQAAASRRCKPLALLQAALALMSLSVSLLPLDTAGFCKQAPALCGRVSLAEVWFTRTGSIWAVGAAFCCYMGEGGEKEWLASALNWEVLLTPVNVCCFTILVWKAIGLFALHMDACGGESPSSLDCLPTTRATWIYASLALLTLLQVSCCVFAALVLRSAHCRAERWERENEWSPCVQARSEKLPRGWRAYTQLNGEVVYQHRKSGRVQRESPRRGPEWDHLTISEAEEGLSDAATEIHRPRSTRLDYMTT